MTTDGIPEVSYAVPDDGTATGTSATSLPHPANTPAAPTTKAVAVETRMRP